MLEELRLSPFPKELKKSIRISVLRLDAVQGASRA